MKIRNENQPDKDCPYLCDEELESCEDNSDLNIEHLKFKNIAIPRSILRLQDPVLNSSPVRYSWNSDEDQERLEEYLPRELEEIKKRNFQPSFSVRNNLLDQEIIH